MNLFFSITILLVAFTFLAGCSKTSQTIVGPSENRPTAGISIQLLDDGSLAKSSGDVLEIVASFTGGKKELLASSYTVPYDERQWFVLYKNGTPVYNVSVNGQPVPASAISEGKIYFTYFFNPLGVQFDNMTPGAKLTKILISYVGLPGDTKVQFRGDFNAWTWVNMKKTSDTTWVAPDSSVILANPDLNQITVLANDSDWRLKQIFVNGVRLERADIERNPDKTIKPPVKIFFTKNSQTGAIINPGNEDLYSVNFVINP